MNHSSTFLGWARGGALSLVLLALSNSLEAQTGVVQEQSGIFAVEFESHPASGDWNPYTTYAGYSGTNYYRWDGADFFNQPSSNGTLIFDVNVQQAGNWQLRIHNRHQHSDSTLENDVWVKMDSGSWRKVYSNNGPSTVKVWNWHTRFDNGSSPHTDVIYSLSAGVHRIQFTGRSKNFMMDRFHLHLPGHPDATNVSLAPSPFEQPVAYCQGKVNSQGCTPAISWTGTPKLSSGNFKLAGSSFVNQKSGLLLYGFDADNAPFQGGTLCIGAPVKRSPFLWTGGSTSGSNCSGVLSFDFAAWANSGADPSLDPGQVVYAQFMARDPQAAQAVALSNAVQFVLQ